MKPGKPRKAKSVAVPKRPHAPAASVTPNAGMDAEQFFAEYGEAIDRGTAAIFSGAGLSMPSGFVDWKTLLRKLAAELGLDMNIEDDLVAVAQYHLNANNGDRSSLNQLLVAEFSRTASPSPSQHAIARLPIRTYWTTNYEALLEDALKANGRKPDVKAKTSRLTTSVPDADCVVYKMHGSLEDPNEMVITREDYGRYARDHAPLLAVLQSELLTKSFLFLGFSFTDPNLEFVLAQIRAWVGASPRKHYAVMRREADAYKANKQRLRVDDLKRYGIHTVLVDEYADIPRLLEELERRYYRRQVVVSGAWEDPAPLGGDALNDLCTSLGRRLIRDNYNVVTGFGNQVGSSVIMGSVEALYSKPEAHLERRLRLRPFPQSKPSDMDEEAFKTRYREDMIRGAGFIVFIAGNRAIKTKLKQKVGGLEVSLGVLEEFAISRKSNLYPLPIGATGSAAAKIWSVVSKDFATIFPEGTPRQAFDALNNKKLSPEKLLDAVFELLHFLTPRTKF